MTDTITYYRPLCALSWKALEIQKLPFPLQTAPSFGQLFIPVFTSEEEAKKHYPDMEIIAMQDCTKGD